MYKTSPTQQVGDQTEQVAADYLIKSGCKIIERNFVSKTGEIDLILKDREFLVFLEVLYRAKEDFGSGAESVTRGKQRKIIRTAQYYLQKRKLGDLMPCRFDIISLTKNNEAALEIDWIKDAFQL
jgi:putative endonuclease